MALREDGAGRLTAEIPLNHTRTYIVGTVRCANGLRVSTPVHTFAGATVNDDRRVYYVPYLPPKSLELPLRELAADLGLDADQVGGRGLRLLGASPEAGSVQPRARLVAGRLYVAHAEVGELTGASSAWLWDGPMYRMEEGY